MSASPDEMVPILLEAPGLQQLAGFWKYFGKLSPPIQAGFLLVAAYMVSKGYRCEATRDGIKVAPSNPGTPLDVPRKVQQDWAESVEKAQKAGFPELVNEGIIEKDQ